MRKNAAIFREIVPAVARANPDGIILVATNPVDVLAYLTYRISGLPAARVIGSGTILDTARFRALLAEHYGVDPRSVHAYIAGEHGDTEVPVWSSANIAGMPLADFATANGMGHDQARLQEIFEATRDAAYQIIERKGATYYAVAAGLMRIVEAILRDQSTVLSVSSLICDYYGIDDVYLSVPTVVGRRRRRADAAPGALGRGGVRAAPLGGAPAVDDRHAGARPARRRRPEGAARTAVGSSRSGQARAQPRPRRGQGGRDPAGAVPPITSQDASAASTVAAARSSAGSAASPARPSAVASPASASALPIASSSRSARPIALPLGRRHEPPHHVVGRPEGDAAPDQRVGDGRGRDVPLVGRPAHRGPVDGERLDHPGHDVERRLQRGARLEEGRLVLLEVALVGERAVP